jgi:formate C-acetyltransferase
MGADWLMDELETLSTRSQDAFQVTEEQKRIYREELYPSFCGRDMKTFILKGMSDEARALQNARVFRLGQTDKGQGHIIPDYSNLLTCGVGALLKDLAARADLHPDCAFYQAAHICMLAFQRLIDRYLALAAVHLSSTSDPAFKQDLQEIYACLVAIREQPPQSFHQALQLFWLSCVSLQLESNASSISIGRFDQFMLPFFNKDVLQDRLDYHKAHLLLSCLWLKMNEVVFLRSSESARYFGGFPTGYNLVLGGVLPNGWDGTSQLSYICLDVTADIRLPQPNASVRVHQSTPTSFLKKTADIILLGFGIPQLFNDDSIILSLVNKGVTLSDARNYGVIGCVQLSIPGKMCGMPDVVLFNLLKGFELVLHRGLDPVSQKTLPVVIQGDIENNFEDFEASVLATIARYVDLACEGANHVDTAHRLYEPVPFLSTMMDGCLDQGKDITEGGAVYNTTGLQQVGIANLADAMLVVKKAVFENKQFTLDQLRQILIDDYAGHEDLRQSFIHAYAKYGNDEREVDSLAARYLTEFCGYVSQHHNPRGGDFSPGSYTVSAHIPMGKTVGATPDGRFSAAPLADGGLSPGSGMDQKGPSSVLRSVSRLDSVLFSNGSLLNLRFHPASFLQPGSFDKFFKLVKTFIQLRLLHVQFSVVSRDDLRDAQQHPERHRDLLVRVAGYSAFFHDLSPEIQDDIIGRCEHHLE